MAASGEDPSMLMLKASGIELASKEIALNMAEMIFKKIYGDEDFQTQVPLKVVDGADRWIVEGNRSAEEHSSPPGQLMKGKTYIEILKANCQVVKLTQKAYLPNSK